MRKFTISIPVPRFINRSKPTINDQITAAWDALPVECRTENAAYMVELFRALMERDFHDNSPEGMELCVSYLTEITSAQGEIISTHGYAMGLRFKNFVEQLTEINYSRLPKEERKALKALVGDNPSVLPSFEL